MIAPTTSSRAAFLSADSGTTRTVPITATTTSTTLSANTDCHDQNSSTVPDVSRPRIALAPATPAQTLIAWGRRSGGNVAVMVDSVAGITSAAPTPRRARNAMSALASETSMAAREAAPNMPRPAIRARRRP